NDSCGWTRTSAASRASRWAGGSMPAWSPSSAGSSRSPSDTNGIEISPWAGRHDSTRYPRSRACSVVAPQTVVFPIPGSPSISNTVNPLAAPSRNAVAVASSRSRPIKLCMLTRSPPFEAAARGPPQYPGPRQAAPVRRRRRPPNIPERHNSRQRRPLLLQPHGFEGFGAVHVRPDMDDQSVANRVEPACADIELSIAPLAPPVEVQANQHSSIGDVTQAFDGEGELVKLLDELAGVPQVLLTSVVGRRLGEARVLNEFHVG